MAAQHFKIVIGCDEPSVVQTITAMLSNSYKDRATLTFTESGQFDDFVQKASSGDYALAIIYPNCLRPAKSCSLLEQAVLAIKTIKATRPVPLIVLTSMEEWLEALRLVGADACLKTPFTLDELRGAVSSLEQFAARLQNPAQ